MASDAPAPGQSENESPAERDVVDPVGAESPAVTSPPARPARRRLSRAQKRNRIILLILLILLLALLSYATYYFVQNRRLPAIRIAPAEAAIQPPQYLYSITGTAPNELDRPVGVAVGPDGRVYAVDFGKRRVSVFSNSGKFLFAFNKTKDGTLHSPVHLAIKGDEIWVSDRRDRTIYIFDLNGVYRRAFVAKNEPKFDWGPLAMAFAPDGGLRATDLAGTASHRFDIFSADGSRTATVGRTFQANSAQESPGGFFFPDGIAVSKDGRIFISDGDNRRIQVFSPTGEFKNFIDTSGIPRGVAIDAKQRLYVVDAVAHSVDIYSLAGKRLTQFGSQGFGPGQFNYPNDVAVDSRRIYVTDRENDQVQVWGWPVAQPPMLRAPRSPLGWLACLLPLLLLLLPLAFRRVHVVVTEDFVNELAEAGEIPAVAARKRLRLSCPEEDHAAYEGRTVDGVDLGELIRGEVHSDSEVRALMQRLEIDEKPAIVLSMASRAKGLGTLDEELRRVAALVDVRVLTIEEFLAEFVRTRKSR